MMKVKINPFVFLLICILFGAVGAAAVTLPVDWKTINSNQKKLIELQKKEASYEAMAKAGVGIWCELAVHYNWVEPEDHNKAMEIIESGAHDN